ncbi:MAG: FxsA family protein [Bradymonadaceae bacterium]|nr:FxsA family protein [Lujinxingiaceae bacterium]
MLAKLLLLFTVIPLIELAILIPLGQAMGLWPTIALVFGTGLLGALLGKSEGLRAWHRIREDLGHGRMPGDAILDGLAVLIAAAFLITPGILSDITGILLLLPFARAPLKRLLQGRFTKMLEAPNISFMSFGSMDDLGGFADHASPFRRPNDDGVIDITPAHRVESGKDHENK